MKLFLLVTGAHPLIRRRNYFLGDEVPEKRQAQAQRFGVFEVNLSARELRKHGIRVRLPGQPFAILAMLLEKPGEVVTREEMRDRLWASDTFVDFEHSLNSAIKKLRAALSDSPENSRYIETVPRLGYRFIAPVEEISAIRQPAASSAVAAVTDANAREIADASRRKTWGKVVLAAAVLIGVTALGLGFRWLKSLQTTPHETLKEMQLTHNSSENLILGSAISPDGKYIVYVDQKGLHLSIVDTSETHDISLPDEIRKSLRNASWFPDGERLILQTRSDTDGGVLWLSSIFGGVPQKLRTQSFSAVVSPQDSSIAFVSGKGHEIWASGPHGENSRRILASDNETYCAVAWSPVGGRLAYAKREIGTARLGGSIATISSEGEAPSTVYSSDRLRCNFVSPLLWMRDGRLVFLEDAPAPESAVNLWAVRTDPGTGIASGNPARLTNWYSIVPWFLSMSRDGRRLGLTKARDWYDVYIGGLQDRGTRMDLPKCLTSSQNFDFPNFWSRDNKSVIFSSNRNQRSQIFRQQLDRDSAELLIAGSSDLDLEDAALSPDGTWIFYWTTPRLGASTEAPYELMRVPSSGGAAETVLNTHRSVMTNLACPLNPAASCIFSRGQQEALVLYALDPVHGQGKELARTKLRRADDLNLKISSDGSHIAISSQDQLPEQIRIVDLVNRTEHNLSLPRGLRILGLAWTPDGKSLFASVSQETGQALMRVELDGNTRLLLDRGKHDLVNPVPSPNGRYLAFSQRTLENNVWLLENF